MLYLYPMPENKKPVYLDYHATTPVDPAVLEAMLPYFNGHFGNPASRSHPFGWQASEGVESARKEVAHLLSVDPVEIIFTSGSTEGLNMGIKGLAENLSYKGKHIITVATEHQAVLDPLMYVSKKGFEITILPVTSDGHIDYDMLAKSIRNDTIMVIVMWANNETGVIHDMNAIGKICNERGVVLICDATQAAGKIETHPKKAGIDFLALTAHKMYGPKGTGAIYINREAKIKPEALIHGGGHEQGFRAGTLNVPGIVGFGKACSLNSLIQQETISALKSLRDKFENRLISSLELVQVNGDVSERLPTVSNLKIPYVDSQAIMTKLRSKLAISSGAACSSANPAPSHVLLAMGLTSAEVKGSIRISLGKATTSAEMELAGDLLIAEVKQFRSESPVWQMLKQGIDVSGSNL